MFQHTPFIHKDIVLLLLLLLLSVQRKKEEDKRYQKNIKISEKVNKIKITMNSRHKIVFFLPQNPRG